MMKKANIWSQCAVIILLMTSIFSGCRSAVQPVTFYTLSSIREIESPPPKISRAPDALIGIEIAQFPDYLGRPQIVSRSGANKLVVSEFNRWGGRLDRDFLNIFAENLSILLPRHRVVLYPWKDQAVSKYKIELDVHQFEGKMGDSVLLNVTWMIRGKGEGTEPLHVTRSIIHQPVSGQDYDALISAYSLSVAELSREVSTVIKSISKQASGNSQ
jgi:uncharacterized lipoprotein YmbA